MAQSSPRTRWHRGALASAAMAAAVSTSAPASAHFILETPPSWMSQDFIGSPQKLGPCGDEAGGTVTSTVTAFAQGQTITVTIDEKIFHPGHYRIALALKDRSELPAEPVVTPGATPCGSAPVQSPPVFPILADGILEHSSAFNGPQTVQVTLPANVTCTKCTLQVIEFMSNHPLNNPGGCFYHHCADISISGSVLPVDGGSGSGSGSGGASASSTSATTSSAATTSATAGAGGASHGGTSSSGHCGFSMPGGDAPTFTGIAGLLAVLTLRRRRR